MDSEVSKICDDIARIKDKAKSSLKIPIKAYESHVKVFEPYETALAEMSTTSTSPPSNRFDRFYSC